LNTGRNPYDEALVRFGDFEPESGHIQMNLLLSSGVKFTAGFIAVTQF